MKDKDWRNRIAFKRLSLGFWYTYLDMPSGTPYSSKYLYEVHYGTKWFGVHKAKKLIRLQEKGFKVIR